MDDEAACLSEQTSGLGFFMNEENVDLSNILAFIHGYDEA